jgi:molecular chaperone DnaJ
MTTPNHYETLDISPQASQAEIKQAYRRLVKLFHPDTKRRGASHDRIAGINAAYEVLSDPQQRESYDRQLHRRDRWGRRVTESQEERQQRTATAQRQHRQRQTGRASDEELLKWLEQVYQPVSHLLGKILNPLQYQIDELAADPFDDELLEDFQAYLEECRESLYKAQRSFRSMPNPPAVAGVAAHLYYCLDQVGDGIDELERFVTSYDDHYLHTGQELFRIAKGLRREAQWGIRDLTK